MTTKIYNRNVACRKSFARKKIFPSHWTKVYGEKWRSISVISLFFSATTTTLLFLPLYTYKNVSSLSNCWKWNENHPQKFIPFLCVFESCIRKYNGSVRKSTTVTSLIQLTFTLNTCSIINTMTLWKKHLCCNSNCDFARKWFLYSKFGVSFLFTETQWPYIVGCQWHWHWHWTFFFSALEGVFQMHERNYNHKQ